LLAHSRFALSFSRSHGCAPSALDYPSKPVHFIICFAAGGPNDITGALVRPIFVGAFRPAIHHREPRRRRRQHRHAIGPGSPADGYTIVFVGPNNFINATMYEKLPFDFIQDSTPVAGTMKLTNVLEVNPDMPVKTVAEYIAYAKANPGKINIGSGGVGTSPHMSGELLKAMTGSQYRPRAVPRDRARPDRPAVRATAVHVRQPSGLDRAHQVLAKSARSA
jgi:tripartite-type tricarboxylate transporter receptor subunit TctC